MNAAEHQPAVDGDSPAPAVRSETLCMLAWARLWSPIVDDAARAETWDALGLPGGFEAQRRTYWNTFHAGVPQPPVPMQLHALLQCDGAHLRETLLRVAGHLEVEPGVQRLPPDHLALLCELLALAIEREERVLVKELIERYLEPWVQAALAAVPAGQAGTRELLLAFADDARRAAR